MPTISIFIRKDDLPLWQELENKSEWLSERLHEGGVRYKPNDGPAVIRKLSDVPSTRVDEPEDDGPDMSMYKWDHILQKAFNTQTEEYEDAKLVNGKIVLL